MRCQGELKSLRAQSVGEVSEYYSCLQFSGYVDRGNESQPGLQLVEKPVTPRPCELSLAERLQGS